MNKNLPLLSICVAAYNVEPYIEECLNSIKNIEKDYFNKEIVIVNDCSKDKTEEKIKKWMENNKDIKVIYSNNEINSWCSWTYYNASKLANWKYITFLDWDDFLIEKSFLKKVKMFQFNKDLKIVYWNCYTYSKSWWFIANFQWDLGTRLNKPLDDVRIMLYTTNPKCSISTSVIDLDFFRKIWWFDPTIQINDWVLNIKIFDNINSIKEVSYLETPCFAYRMSDWNMTKNYENMLKEQEKIIAKYVKEGYRSIWYSNIYYEVSLLYLRQCKYKKAFTFIKLSLIYKFSFSRILFFLLYLIIPLDIIERIPGSYKKLVLSFLWL